jgi:hypothetical protein
VTAGAGGTRRCDRAGKAGSGLAAARAREQLDLHSANAQANLSRARGLLRVAEGRVAELERSRDVLVRGEQLGDVEEEVSA